MLLVHPVREVLRFLPAVLVVLVAGSGRDGMRWELLGIVVPVAIGLLRYLTTRFRIAEGRIELRTGLLVRRSRTAVVHRVRAVDLEASPIHRVLGLTSARIGTGTSDDEQQIHLDGLTSSVAQRLRDDLLRVTPLAVDPTPPVTGSTGDPGPQDAGDARVDAGAAAPGAPAPCAEADGAAPEPAVLALDPRWARYAPLTSTGVVVLAAVVGFGGQLADRAASLLPDAPPGLTEEPAGVGAVVVLGLVLLLVAAALMSLFAVVGYLVGYWGFTLRHLDGSWQLRRGLTTTRETSIDDERLAGVRLHEPLSLRVAGAARLGAIVTGLGSAQSASALLVPPAPRREVDRVVDAVIGAPVARAELVPHGPAAARRRWLRALVPATLVLLALVTGVLRLDLAPWWLAAGGGLVVLAVALAADRVRGLGHAHVEGHVVARSGSLARRREVLGDDHVIGWNLRATFFQRRAGLTGLAATTAGGPQSVGVLDVPEDQAVALALAVLPDVVRQFLSEPCPAPVPAPVPGPVPGPTGAPTSQDG